MEKTRYSDPERALKIVEELARYASGNSTEGIYSFCVADNWRVGDEALVIDIAITKTFRKDVTRMVTLPPGEECGCCGGSGTAP